MELWRTQNLEAPFPEEGNRRLVAQIARYHFAPTDAAMDNLLRENIPADSILVTGNTAIDALFHAQRTLERQHDTLDALLDTGGLIRERGEYRRLILITGHRRENWDRFETIGSSVLDLAVGHPASLFVVPVHPNTRIPTALRENLSKLPNVRLTAPLNYLLFVRLMTRAYLILTDSGGIQEEALTLGRPVLIMRNATERGEAVSLGTARLIGNSRENIIEAVDKLLKDEMAYRRMAVAHNTFGDGASAVRIVGYLARELGRQQKRSFRHVSF